MSAYGELARYYDGLTRDVDYTQWVAWYQKWFQRSEVPVKIVLDLACGTGTLTCLLAQAGYSMIGTDLSIEMLSEAQEKALELTCEPPVFLHQSMDKLDLFGTIDACVSSLDSLNYVTDEAILRAAFHKIHTFLMPNGCFLFDILAPAHLRSLDGQMFVDETEDVFCLWRAEYDRENAQITYGMDLFERDGDCWYQAQEEHTERAWEPEFLKQMLLDAGFASVAYYGGMEERPPRPDDRRLTFVCVNGEGGQQIPPDYAP